MTNPHFVVMFGGILATFIGCAVAMFAATKAGDRPERRAKSTRRA